MKRNLDNEDKVLMRFAAIGDFGRSTRHTAGIAKQIANRSKAGAYRLILGLGDNFYPAGVQDVNDKKFQTVWYNVFVRPHESLYNTPWYLTLGNHDYMMDPQAQVDYTRSKLNINGLWRMPDRSYRFEEALSNGDEVAFFCVDTNGAQQWMPSECVNNTAKSLAELEAALSTCTARWKVVFGHHAVYTMGDHHGEDGDRLRQYGLQAILVRYGVHLYFSGHEHVMQYRCEAGVHHFVAGSGGGDAVRFYAYQDPARSMDWYDRSVSVMGFAHVDVFANALQVSFVAEDGSTVFSKTIE